MRGGGGCRRGHARPQAVIDDCPTVGWLSTFAWVTGGRCGVVGGVFALAVGLVGAAGCSAAAPEPGTASDVLVLPTPAGVAADASIGSSPEAVTPPSAMTNGSSTPPGASTGSRRSIRSLPVPAAGRMRTIGGAETFVRHFISEYNRALTMPAEGLLMPLSSTQCSGCVALEKSVSDYVKDKERFSKTPIEVLSSGVRPAKSAFLWAVVTEIKAHRASIVDARGTPVQWQDEEMAEWEFQIQWDGKGWRVLSVTNSG